MANVIAKVQRPTLILAHNKTLGRPALSRIQNFFPENAVEYFVSYYDYYQPEAYIPRTDTYIEKDMAINDKIDKMRLSATRSLLESAQMSSLSLLSRVFMVWVLRNTIADEFDVCLLGKSGGAMMFSCISLKCNISAMTLILSAQPLESVAMFLIFSLLMKKIWLFESNFSAMKSNRISEIDPFTGKVKTTHSMRSPFIRVLTTSHRKKCVAKRLKLSSAELEERMLFYENEKNSSRVQSAFNNGRCMTWK